MVTKLKSRDLKRYFLKFCKNHKVNPEDLLYTYCEGRLDNFPYWYADYLKYVRNEVKNRVNTGIIHEIKLEDVWS